MDRAYNIIKVVALFLVLLVVLLSCGAGVVDEPVPDASEPSRASGVVGRVAVGSSVAKSSVSIQTGSVEGSGSVYRPVVMERPPVSYLREVVPPCLPAGESERDPCRGAPGFLEHAGSSSGLIEVLNELPSFNDILLAKVMGDKISPGLIPHIVIRGTIQTDTTRCELYPIREYSYDNPSIPSITGGHHYYCFADVSIHEYIIGEGPAELTVGMHKELALLTNQQLENWANIRDEWVVEWLEDPQTRTASLYEGKELVLLLRVSSTVVLESWAISGWWGTVWFLQRDDDGEIRALEQEISRARTPEERSQLDLPLSELIQQIKEAAEHRATVTGGRIGEDPTLPMLVNDANRLQDFYSAVGAVYEGEDATVLPPPVPGGDEPEQDPTKADETQPEPTIPAPGEEETAPPPTDDATTTSTSAAPGPQTEDTASSTTSTTTPPADSSTTAPAVDTDTTRPQAGDKPSTTSTTQPADDEETTTTLPQTGDTPSTTTTTAVAPQAEDTTTTGTTQPPANSEPTLPAVDTDTTQPQTGDAGVEG